MVTRLRRFTLATLRTTTIVACFSTALVFVLVLTLPLMSHALLPQTERDLRVAEDRLEYEVELLRDRREIITPILVATPQVHWEESKADFAGATFDMLKRVFRNSGELIACAECFQNRVFVSRDNRMVVQNGELALADLARLRERPGFENAKSVLIARETPSGIDLRLIAVDDGRILYAGLSDASQTLDAVEPPLRLAKELDRRQRGDALSYFHMDIGLYPEAVAQLKWLEQWGDRNQHLSGLAIGAFNPTGAIGATYLYMLPTRRWVTVGVTGYYSLKGVFASDSQSIKDAITAQVSLNYSLSGAYGVFASGDSKGVLSVGLSLQNPIFLPFLF